MKTRRTYFHSIVFAVIAVLESLSPWARPLFAQAPFASGPSSSPGFSANALGPQPALVSSGTYTSIASSSQTAPGQTTKFSSFGNPVISGSNLAFYAYYNQSYGSGIYTVTAGTTGVMRTADQSTIAPGQSASFYSFSYPVISGSNVAFHATYNGYHGEGIYTGTAGTTGVTRIADITTSAPGQSATFTSFGNPVISGSNLAFYASTNGTGGGGICTSKVGTTGATLMAGYGMTAPSQSTAFSGFGLNPAISGDNVAFYAAYSNNGAHGIYTGIAGTTGATRVVDTSMVAPGQSTLFYDFYDFAISGSNLAFYARINGAGNGGIYTGTAGTTGATRIADTSMVAPGQSTSFSTFGPPVISGSNVAFSASYNNKNSNGIYTAVAGATGATRIADYSTIAPGHSSAFSGFGSYPVISGSNVAFYGYYSGGSGIFLSQGGILLDVVDIGDSLFGSTISALSFSTSGLDGGNLTFGFTLANGVSGVAIFSTLPANNPLVFIPGIAGSKLTGNGQTGNPPTGGNNKYLWPTVSPSDIDALNLRTGVQGVKAVDVVSDYGELGVGLALVTVYKPFIAHITGTTASGGLGYSAFNLSDDPTRLTTNFSQGYSTGSGVLPRYFPFPYDWRQSYATNTATLHAYIANIRQLYGGAKVNIVAHSAGGLLLRRYILDYGSGDIDKVITVGSPFLGAPKAIYRTLTGNFNGPPVDWLTRPDMRAALATLPGVHELLPSDLYLNNGGSPVFSEDHWDINDDHTSDSNGAQVYTSSQYKALMNAQVAQNELPLASPDVPSQNADLFHNYLASKQDNWSADDGSIKYLHICGQQTTDATTVAVTARAETRFGWTPFPQQIFRFRETFGAGDGVVPLFSAQRLPQFLAPGAVTRVVPGANSAVEHTALMGNTDVLGMIDAFLNGATVPTAPSAPASTSTAKRHIEISGCGYVTLFNTANYQNTKLSDLAAQQIPGVTVQYGGSDPWVNIDVDSNVDLTVQGATADQVIEVAVTQFDASGNRISFRRYQLSPTGRAWQAFFPPNSGSSGTSARPTANATTAPDPVVSVDANGNGTFEANEQVAPAYSNGSGPVDTTPPSLDATISSSGNSLVVNLTARDDGSVAPTILYTLNDGPVQTYGAPLTFTPSNATVLKAFAQDGAGNTSGMMTTTVGPTVTAQGTAAGLVLQWPQADAYVLEQTDSLGGTWTKSTTQITRNGMIESATVPLGTSKQGFFRLRSQTVTK